MANCETLEELLAIKKGLGEKHDMIGWLCTNHRYSVNYRDNPEAVKRIQPQLDIAAEFINVIYIHSLLDEAGFKPSNKWISIEDKNEFKAWVHVRNTGAHAPGGRANQYFSEFDRFMNSTAKGLSGLKQNCKWDSSSLELSYTMSHRFYQFSQHLIDRAIGYCANGGLP